MQKGQLINESRLSGKGVSRRNDVVQRQQIKQVPDDQDAGGDHPDEHGDQAGLEHLPQDDWLQGS